MRKETTFLLAALFIAALCFLPQHFTFAQNAATVKERERLRRQLETVRQEIDSYRGAADERRVHAATLEEETRRLGVSIAGEEEAIARRSARIESVSGEIKSREREIERLERLSENRRHDLIRALQEFVEQDHATILEMLLAGRTVSEGVERLEALTQLQSAIGLELDHLRTLRRATAERAAFLDEQRVQEHELRRVQQLASAELERKRQEKDRLLDKTKGEERRYQDLVAQSGDSLEAIRRQLYILEGVGVALRFEEALTLAEQASARTGIRPAFLLAVLQKESHWGGYQGTGTWREDMHPRDHAAFLAITKELGLNPDVMPVSKKPWYGWGGAMGPAQFLPTTWLDYKDGVAQLAGAGPANPWNITHAFIAAVLKLSRGGAAEGEADSEWKAAMIYFAGKNWRDESYAFYGNSVMELAAALQAEIDALSAP
ncbi:MAG: lytic murein transglycosylase [bacterium]|nr:lytic murein transglycosylase [bacterium]MDZ4296321.1 lytic murein transglycosylase [Patescibacteria group bacterium]